MYGFVLSPTITFTPLGINIVKPRTALATCKQAFATHRHKAFVSIALFDQRDSGERANLPGIRLLFPSLISLGLENTGLIIFSASGNKVYLCESMSDKISVIAQPEAGIHLTKLWS